MHNSFNMRTFEIYLVFTICTLGTLLFICSGFDQELLYKEIITLHNKKRSNHYSQDLILDEELCKFAMDDEVLDQLEKDGNSTYFENVCFLLYKTKEITDLSAKNVVLPWYNERINYDYKIEPQNLDAEHFTQIVWRATQSIGFALVERNDEYWLVIAYFPAGNQVNMYINNVKEPIE